MFVETLLVMSTFLGNGVGEEHSADIRELQCNCFEGKPVKVAAHDFYRRRLKKTTVKLPIPSEHALVVTLSNLWSDDTLDAAYMEILNRSAEKIEEMRDEIDRKWSDYEIVGPRLVITEIRYREDGSFGFKGRIEQIFSETDTTPYNTIYRLLSHDGDWDFIAGGELRETALTENEFPSIILFQ